MFLAKIKRLEGMYASIRRARGDGNCFFRSFVFAYMEHLVFTADLTERNRYTIILTTLLVLMRPTWGRLSSRMLVMIISQNFVQAYVSIARFCAAATCLSLPW